MSWLDLPAHHRWLEAETDRLLDFSRGSLDPAGGFGWLDEHGVRDPGRPVELWISCRMTHVFALGHLLGRPGCGELVDHGVTALRERFHDAEHGGWWASVGADGPVVRDKTAYEHAFVVLAASSAVVAGRPGAGALLEQALGVLLEHFWDDEAGMVVEQWDETFTELDGYRGINSNMHTVEALLAAHDATGDRTLLDRAVRTLTRAYASAFGNDLRLPEHYDASWHPLLDYNEAEPAHPFRPYGATVGHGFEWARLGVQTHVALGADAPDWVLDGAVRLFAAGAREGWAVDGRPGFVYTVDWAGAPVVRERMHWVAAEAVAAASSLARVTGDASYAEAYERWWDHVGACFVDREHGSWRHELDADLRPSARTWSGKPDTYHAVQATLIPRLPPGLSVAEGLRQGALS